MRKWKMVLPLTYVQKIVGTTDLGKTGSLVLDILSLRWLLDIQIEMSCRQLDTKSEERGKVWGRDINLGVVSLYLIFKEKIDMCIER